MDGMLRSPALGILYAEDFDAVPEPERAPEPLPEPGPPPLTQEDIDTACAAAVATARAGWEAEEHGRRTEAVSMIGAGLATAFQETRSAAETLAGGTVRTMLSMLAGALPGLCAAHGDTEVRALLRHVLPSLQREPRVTIRVNPGLVTGLQCDLALLDEELSQAISVVAAPLPPGDVRVTWTDGSLTRDSKAMLGSMREALSQLGLLDPEPTTTERRMALAH